MALALTEDHAQLADAVRSWAARTCPPSAARTAADGDDSGAASYRDTIRPGLAELGHALVPGDFVPTVLAAAVLASAGVSGKVVASLAQGTASGAVALTADIQATGIPRQDLVITGSADCVLGA